MWALEHGVRSRSPTRRASSPPASSRSPRSERGGGRLIPVDSEHSALFQCAQLGEPESLVLTASGGPFRGRSRDELADMTRGTGARPSDLDDGREDHDRLGDARQQGARGDRGALPLRPAVRPDRGGRPPDVDRARARALPRRRGDRAPGAARHARPDLLRAHLPRPRGDAGADTRPDRRPARVLRARHRHLPPARARARGGRARRHLSVRVQRGERGRGRRVPRRTHRLPRHRGLGGGRARPDGRRTRARSGRAARGGLARPRGGGAAYGRSRGDPRARDPRDDPRGGSLLCRARRRDDAAEVLSRLRAADREDDARRRRVRDRLDPARRLREDPRHEPPVAGRPGGDAQPRGPRALPRGARAARRRDRA